VSATDAVRAVAALASVPLAQGPASGPSSGWPLSWLFGLFALGAIVAALAATILLVRWRRPPRGPTR
jgi:hypothetical protein